MPVVRPSETSQSLSSYSDPVPRPAMCCCYSAFSRVLRAPMPRKVRPAGSVSYSTDCASDPDLPHCLTSELTGIASSCNPHQAATVPSQEKNPPVGPSVGSSDSLTACAAARSEEHTSELQS